MTAGTAQPHAIVTRTCAGAPGRPGDVPRAGPRPPGHPGRRAGCSPTPRPRSASTASSPRTRPGTFLLESAEHGGVWSRYSFVGARSRRDPDRARRRGALDRRAAGRACPPAATRSRRCATRSRPCTPPRFAGLPPLTGGLVGCLDLRRRPPLGAAARRHAATTCDLPELAMMLATDLAVLDHTRRLAAARRQRGQLRRDRRARRARPGPTPSPGSTG